VIHRDLKPENVLLAPGSPKVIDFGIARAFEATSQHTRTGQMVGTVSYMAPERFSARPGTALTPAADIFAWGCVIAYAGTGHTPFQGDSPEATAARILTQPPYLDGLAEPLRGFIESATVKNPEDRPTARELLDLLVGGLAPASSRRLRPAGPSSAMAAFLTPGAEYRAPGARAESRASDVRPESRASDVRPESRASDVRPGSRARDAESPAAEAGGAEQSAAEPRASRGRTAEPRSASARPGGLRPEVAAFIEQSASRTADPAPEEPRSGASRPAGLRPELAAFIEQADPAPASTGRSAAAGGRAPNGSRLHAPSHGTPDGASALDRLRHRTADRIRGVRGGRWLARSTVLLVVGAIVAVIGAGVWLGRTLTSGADQDTGTTPLHTLGAASGSGVPSAGSELTEPTGGDVIVQDSLSRAGRWPDTPPGKSQVRCFTGGGALRAVRTNRIELGDFRCKGPADVIDGDFGVEVTTALQSAGSCAAIWFRWNADVGGQQLRICGSGISVAEDTPGSRQVLGTFAQARPIPLRTKTRIHLVVRGQSATLWQDNRLAGSVPLPVDGPREGQALLGINVENGDDDPPYSVSFTDVEIRSLGG
jgi:hypothetical protein